MSLPNSFLSRLGQEFPQGMFSQEEDDLRVYGTDWTRVYAPKPSVIAFPRTTEEVSRILRLAHEYNVGVVPSGGRTGLAGGAVAVNGEVVLSLARMRTMSAVDELAATVRVQAGITTAEVHAHVEPFGLTWPVDFASKGSSQVGGNIATNAGGVKVIRYGLTRQWVLGLQVVLADGKVLELNGALEKNNTGVDLRQLFIGTEGIFGVVTEATLKLTKLPKDLSVFLFAVKDVAAVLSLFREARRGAFTIMAYEFFSHACFERLARHRKVRLPFPETHGCYVLLEVESGAQLDEWVGGLLSGDLVADGVLAQHAAQARELWELREGISESLSATGLPHKNDVALPIAELRAFTENLHAVFESKYPGWEICIFGHVGDGNLHINVMKPDALSREEFFKQTKAADRDLFELVRSHKGSISAEHGIGLLKKEFLSYSRTEDEIELMRGMKRVLDPKGILNPGKVL